MKSLRVSVFTAFWRGCFGVCLVYGSCLSQCIPIDFSSPVQACLNQNIAFTPSGNYASYEWDFCAGDLEGTPSSSSFLSYSGSNTIELVEDNGSYFGFFLSGPAAKLYRLDFGSSITNAPAVLDLGGLGINLNNWRTIKIAKEGVNYYGFLIGNNTLYRITFGPGLTSAPSDAQLIYSGAPLSSPIDMVYLKEGSTSFLFIVNLGNEAIARFQINSLADAPGLFQMSQVPVTGAGLLAGISFMKECDNWYALTSAIGIAKIYKVFFGAGLSDPNPTVSPVVLGFWIERLKH